MNSLDKIKKYKIYSIYEKGNETKRLTFLLLLFAFFLCPLFSFLLKWLGAPLPYFYALFSGTFIFPIILLLEKTITLFKGRIQILYFIYFNVLTFYIIYFLGQNDFSSYDFSFFLGLFSVLNFSLQKFYLSLIYFINSFVFLVLIFIFYDVDSNSNYESLVALFFCVGLFILVIYYSRNKMVSSLQDHTNYLNKIVNNIGNGVLLFQIRGNFITVIDFNKEINILFKENDYDEIANVLNNLLDTKDIEYLLKIKNDEFLIKEVTLNEIFVELKITKIILNKKEHYITSIQDITTKKTENNLIVENEKKYKNLFIRNQTGVFTLNLDGEIIDCNPAFLEIFQKNNFREIDLFFKDEWYTLLKDLNKNEKIINYRKTYTNEIDKTYFFVFRFYIDFENNQIEGNVLDITDITLSTKALKEKENLYRLIYEESNDSILLLDDDRIIDINQKGLELLNEDYENIKEKSFWDFTYFQSPELKLIYDGYFAELKKNKQIKFNWLFAKNNSFMETSVSIVALNINDETFYQCVIRDETERNLSLRSLEQSKQTFESIIENTPEGFLILNKTECLFANSEFFNMFEIKKTDSKNIKLNEDFFGLNYKKFVQTLEEHKKDKLIKLNQLKFIIAGKTLEIDLTVVSIIFNDIEATMLIFKNVSFQYNLSREILRAEVAEESNKKLEKEIEDKNRAELKLEAEYLRTNAIFDSSENTLLLTLTPDLKFSSFNKQSKIFFDSQTKKELKINIDFEIYFNQIISEIKLRYFRYLASGLRKGNSYQLELKIINIYNEKKWLEIYLNPIKDIIGNVSEFSLVAHDITDKKEAEKKILLSLKEKEVLLKEVHHRVKNNLQIISSILNLQSSYIEDEKILEILEESRHRIRSMAIIHENLYNTTNFSSINFKNYSRELVRNLISSYQFQKDLEIDLIENVDLVELSLDQAIPCGLIINELITNSMKYAFLNRKKGKIYLDLKEKNNNITIVVGDDGLGLPKDFDINKTETLGLQLVITLVEQLDGVIKIENKKGIKYFITFGKQNL